MTRTWVPLAFLFGEAFVFALAGGVVAIVVSRWGGAALMGQYSLVLAWIALFQAIANFGLAEFTMRELGRRPDQGDKQIGHSLLIGGAAALLGMLLMAATIMLFGYPEATRQALLLGVLTLLPMTLASISRAGFLAHERPAAVFAVALVESLIAGVVNCWLAYSGHGVLAFVVTMLAVKLLSCVFSLRLLKRRVAQLWPAIDPAFCRSMLATLLTFGAGNILGTLSMRINLILLSVWASLPAVGLYAAASKVMELTLMIPAIFAQALLSKLSQGFAQRDTAQVKSLLAGTVPWLLAMVIVLSAGVCLFAARLLQALFGAEFSAGSTILRLLMLFLVLESLDTVMSVTLKAAGRERLDVGLFAGNVAVNIGASLLLIPAWGGLGCALAKMLGGLASGLPRGVALLRMAATLGWTPTAAARRRAARWFGGGR